MYKTIHNILGISIETFLLLQYSASRNMLHVSTLSNMNLSLFICSLKPLLFFAVLCKHSSQESSWQRL